MFTLAVQYADMRIALPRKVHVELMCVLFWSHSFQIFDS